MKLVLLDNYDAISDFAAKYVCKRINQFYKENPPNGNKFFTLGLPTGSSPLGMYRRLVEMYKSGQVSFEKVKTFNMDEYIGIPRDHPQSYHTFMFEKFFRHIDIDPNNINIPNGEANDLEAECACYENEIKRAGGIELFISGIGSDGHIAFNEPGSSLASRTRVQALNSETIAANARFFNGIQQHVPSHAITVGVGTIMDAREVLMLVSGEQKAIALQKSVEKGISHWCTGSALQMHPNSIWLADDDATGELKVKTLKFFKSQLADYMELLK